MPYAPIYTGAVDLAATQEIENSSTDVTSSSRFATYINSNTVLSKLSILQDTLDQLVTAINGLQTKVEKIETEICLEEEMEDQEETDDEEEEEDLCSPRKRRRMV